MAAAEELVHIARTAALHAHTPYSGFHVGAAVLFTGSAQVYVGCNVENASYGLTICAERVAVCSGIAAGWREIAAIAVAVLDANKQPRAGFMPCGACRQFLAEFSTDKTQVIVDNCGTWYLHELLPHAFGLSHG